MQKKRFSPEEISHVTIERLAEGNQAICRVGDKVIFVTQAVPGDIMDIAVTRQRKDYAEAHPIYLHQPGPSRQEPFCAHFGSCGGCQWQHVSYDRQLAEKTQQVIEKITRIAKIEKPPVATIIPADQPTYYRNKLDYTFSNKRWLSEYEIASGIAIDRRAIGFHKAGSFDKVIDIQHCYLQNAPSNEIRLAIKAFAIKEGYSFYDINNQTGLLRNLIIRTAETGQVMVIIQFGATDELKIDRLMAFIDEQFPQLDSLQYVINTKLNDTFYDLPVHCYKGKPFIIEKIDELQWQIGPNSFFQTNTLQAAKLYQNIMELAQLQGNELIFDLYAGVGTITHFLAKKARQVIGIESVAGAVDDAKKNAKLNNLDNVSFLLGDMKDLFQEICNSTYGKPDVIVTDPPRAGMHPHVIKQLLNLGTEKIIYVSCNPATQARDMYLLKEMYHLAHAQPIDMFPHTSHVENVALLVKKR